MKHVTKYGEAAQITGGQVAESGDEDARRAWADQKRDCAEAEYFLGECHDFGEHGLSKDDTLARYWYERAARHGDVCAMTNLGYMFAHGNGVEVDGEKAVGWYELASANGSYLAMGNFAYFHLTGMFVGKADPAKAVRLYEKVVKMAPECECYKYDLGTCYENGIGTAVDMKRAIALYRDAARLGSGLAKKALRRLGVSYENKSQVGKIALAISAFRSEVPDLCRSPIRSEGRWASLHSIIRLAGVPPR